MALHDIFINTGAALGIFAGLLNIVKLIPDAYNGLLWIVKRTKTKKDDEIVEDIGTIKP